MQQLRRWRAAQSLWLRSKGTVAGAAASVEIGEEKKRVKTLKDMKGPGAFYLALQAYDTFKADEWIYKWYKDEKVVKVKTPRMEDAVLLFDHEDIRHVFLNEGEFPMGPSNDLYLLEKWAEDSFGKKPSLSLIDNGEIWKRSRSILQPGANMHSVGEYVPAIVKAAQNAAKHFPGYAEKRSIDRWSRFASFDMFCAVSLGESYNTIDPDCQDPIAEMIELDDAALGMLVKLTFLPWVLRPKDGYEKMCTAFDRIYELTKPKIYELVENRKSANPRHSWFGDIMERSNLSPEELASTMPALLAAGIGTTMAFLQLILLQLALNPDKQQNLYKEIAANLQDGNFRKDVKMPYLDAVIRETHRLTPSVPNLTSRLLENEVLLPSGYLIPAKTQMYLSPLQSARDTSIVESPDKFMPERFFESTCPHAVTNRLTKDPFGLGKRLCLGKRVAETELRAVVCAVVSQYEFVATPLNQRFQMKLSTTGYPDPFPVISVQPRKSC